AHVQVVVLARQPPQDLPRAVVGEVVDGVDALARPGDVADRLLDVDVLVPDEDATDESPRTTRPHPRSAAILHTASRRRAYTSTLAPATTCSRARAPIASARSASESRPESASASASGSSGGTRTTFSPSRSASGSHSPRVRVSTTGRAHAIACRVTLWPEGCGTSRTGTATAAARR